MNGANVEQDTWRIQLKLLTNCEGKTAENEIENS